MKTTPLTGSSRALAALALGCLLLLGCGRQEAANEPPGDTEASPAKTMVGELHFAGQRLRVEPFVMRTPEMDLFVACRLAKEAREKEGKPAGDLCYDPAKRAAFSQILIEELPGSSVGTQMRLLSSRDEAAHFLVERTGTIYQILDMAYAPRRDGEVRGDEVRVLSGSEEGTEKLLKMLREHFPDFKVNRGKPTPDPVDGHTKPKEANHEP